MLSSVLNAGPVARIALRYAIGYLAAKGILPDDLASMITASDEAIDVIQGGICVGLGVCVERAYVMAKTRGWNL